MEGTQSTPRSFEFTGNGFEYFRIWIVNLLLTIVTLGIFSAWAKVRRLRYFYGHTLLDGHAFDYLADPVKILKGRLLAVALLALYSFGTTFLPGLSFFIVVIGVLLVPLVIVTASAFTMRNSAYRNIRFGFRAAVREAYGVLLPPLGGLLLLVGIMYFSIDPSGFTNEDTGEAMTPNDLLPTYISLGLLPLLPWLDCVRMRFVVSHTRFGNLQGGFSAGLKDFYVLYFLFFIIMLLVIVGAGVVVAIAGAVAAVLNGPPVEGAVREPPSLAIFVPAVVIAYSLLFIAGAWFAAHRGNLLRNSASFGGNALQGSLEVWALAKLYVGNLILIVLTLGLFIPFASVRLHRYNAQRTAVDTQGLDGVVAVADQDPGAFGEEIGEVFDVDIGL